MRRHSLVSALLLCISTVFTGTHVYAAQQRTAQTNKPHSSSQTKSKTDSPTSHLVRVQTIQATSQMATEFYSPLKCDQDGNIYLQDDPVEPAIHKLDPKGNDVALFRPTANPDLKVDVGGYFTIAPSGEVYEIVMAHEITRYVFEYQADGTLRSKLKLQTGFAWIPSTLAVFPSGHLVISGLAYDRNNKDVMQPFSGIFSPDGNLLKEIHLQDDDDLRDMAANGDARVSSPVSPRINRAISASQLEIGADGNAYLMRWTTPAIFYAISAGGETVRRFVVDPGDQSFRPVSMHISGQRIAVLFVDPQTHQKLMKLVDLEGHELATYDEVAANSSSPTDMLGGAFACYSANPERFTFLGADDKDRVQFWIAEPR
jgi:hypothetical protein